MLGWQILACGTVEQLDAGRSSVAAALPTVTVMGAYIPRGHRSRWSQSFCQMRTPCQS